MPIMPTAVFAQQFVNMLDLLIGQQIAVRFVDVSLPKD
jgi:hypothetical protein